MSGRRILLIQGHPDRGPHFGHALLDAYAQAARSAGHEVQTATVADLDFPVLRSKAEWDQGALPPGLEPVRQALTDAQHVVLFFPLWLGDMPALLKAFLEQLLRPGFAIDAGGKTGWKKRLQGRSARVVVTMGMPAIIYRWYFRAHSVKALERNILGFVGFAPIHQTLIGNVEGDAGQRKRWLAKLAALGARGE